MAGYVQLGDVRTYYEEDGAGAPLVLLHPGLADSRVFEGNLPGLAARFRVYRPDRRGHGRTADVPGPISYAQMAADTVAFVERVVGGPVFLLGHSDGAVVALLTALQRPDLVRRLVFGAGVFHHDGWAPGAIDLDAETLDFFAGYRSEVAPDGAAHFPEVVAKLDRMHRQEPALTPADLAGYPGPALVMVGDGDDEIPMEHTLALRAGLPDARLAVVPGTGHGFLADKPDLCNHIVVDFLTEERPAPAPPGIVGLDHVALPVQRLEALMAFYGALGFDVPAEAEWRRPERPRLSIAFGDQKLNLHAPQEWQDPAFTLRAPVSRPGCGDLCFVWRGGVAALLEALRAAGAAVEAGPVERIGGRDGGRARGTSVYTRDPDGNLLEFIVYDA
jgi:pimeloyl-ACP methyl ester carboxylesterase/catechol 2,3-dioxygenase-like lactoylglutathione lyase family enzyme